MSGELRTIPTPRGDFIFRPERPDDEPFLFRLFTAHNSTILRQSGFAAEMIDRLMEFQFRSQARTYRSMYPDAIYSIVLWDGREVGRFIEHDETDVVYAWHPWAGRRVRVHEVIERATGASARCRIVGAPPTRVQEIPV